jgi:hypothetical protein
MLHKLQNLCRAEWDVDMIKNDDQEEIQKQAI